MMATAAALCGTSRGMPQLDGNAAISGKHNHKSSFAISQQVSGCWAILGWYCGTLTHLSLLLAQTKIPSSLEKNCLAEEYNTIPL
jgi:hypothetical protein